MLSPWKTTINYPQDSTKAKNCALVIVRAHWQMTMSLFLFPEMKNNRSSHFVKKDVFHSNEETCSSCTSSHSTIGHIVTKWRFSSLVELRLDEKHFSLARAKINTDRNDCRHCFISLWQVKNSAAIRCFQLLLKIRCHRTSQSKQHSSFTRRRTKERFSLNNSIFFVCDLKRQRFSGKEFLAKKNSSIWVHVFYRCPRKLKKRSLTGYGGHRHT